MSIRAIEFRYACEHQQMLVVLVLLFRPDPFPYESLGIQRPDEDDSQHKYTTDSDSKRQALSKFFYIRTFVRSFDSIKHSLNIPKRIADTILDTFIR
jgi:hypothetical protein